eukprot:CAMPEP_0197856954 /NCGR_PEP_ID=MMETSP1438-20131217/29551_1 /TAXON_ID=1461541 /ORGANISM="Pterosperma sp., Strain CCMP1384" /LENGTH=283 /DNA_ID=CAMNT_0043472601 /DNA_START=262 /DNA_END=1110 /DNA_ORIENTATION=-
MAPKTKKKKKRKDSKVRNDDQEDEILALEAIYPGDFYLPEGSVDKFKVHIAPVQARSDSESSAPVVAVDLIIQFGPSYPRKVPQYMELKSSGTVDVQPEHMQEMEQQVVALAADLARTHQVMVFNLVEAVREYLASKVAPEVPEPQPDRSLWEDMQHREALTAAASAAAEVAAETSDPAGPSADTDMEFRLLFDDCVDIGLFDLPDSLFNASPSLAPVKQRERTAFNRELGTKLVELSLQDEGTKAGGRVVSTAVVPPSPPPLRRNSLEDDKGLLQAQRSTYE